MVGKSFPKIDGESFVQKVQKWVYEWGGDSDHAQAEYLELSLKYSLNEKLKVSFDDSLDYFTVYAC